MKRYHIVHGDTTTTGGRVIAVRPNFTNRRKSLALIGDQVFCNKYNTIGRIAADGPRRSISFMGQQAAFDRDLCMCKCDPKPRLVNSMDNMRLSMTPELGL